MQFPPSTPTKLSALFTISMLIAGLLFSTVHVEGQGKKTRRAIARSGNSSGKAVSRSRTARRSKSNRNRAQSEPLPIASQKAAPTYPDNIEVIENGSSESADIKRLLNMPNTNLTGSDSTELATPTKRVNIRMDASRVLEIQQALAAKGFYQDEMTGVYDESTVDAMRRFQLNEKIPVTGYPTAHALRRLGLAKW